MLASSHTNKIILLLLVSSVCFGQRRIIPYLSAGGGSPPGVPTLVSPINFAVEQDSNSLQFKWNTVSGATSYQIQIDDDPAFGSTFKDSSSITDTSASFSGLAGRTFYYWHVRATNGYGSSSYSLKWELKTKTYIVLCSTKPSYFGYKAGFGDSASVLGSDGAQSPTVTSMQRGDLMVVYCLDRANVTFSVTSDGGQRWTAGDDVGTTANSQLWYTTFNGIWTTSPYFSTSGTSTPFSTTAHVFRPCDTTHAWGLSANEASATFTAPSAPYRMIAPSITTGKDSSVVLSFRATQDDNSDTNNVRVPGSNLMTRSGPERGVQNIGGSDTYMSTWYKIYNAAGATGADTVYQSNRGGDAGVYSKIAFYDSALALPSAVTLIGPTDTQTGVSLNPTFTWSTGAVYGFVSDRIQIDSVGTGFTALTKDSSITATGGTASFGGLSPSKTYYWRVRRTNYRGTSSWSSTFSFTTGTGTGVSAYDYFATGPSAEWTANNGTWAVTGDSLYTSTSNTDVAIRYTGSALNGITLNQYSEIQLGSFSTSNGYCTAVVWDSANTGCGSFYGVFTDGTSGAGHTAFYKSSAGSTSELASIAETFVVGDKLKIAIVFNATADTLKAYKNGSLIGTTTSKDATITGGRPGIHSYNNGGLVATACFRAWWGGDTP